MHDVTLDRFGRRRGISTLAVVILVVMTVVLVPTALMLYARWADLERLQKSLRTQLNDEKVLLANRHAEIQRQLPPTGFFKTAPDLKELNGDLSRAELDKRMQAVIPVYSGDDAKGREEVKFRAEGRVFPTLSSVVESAASRMTLQHARMKNLMIELEAAKASSETRERWKGELVKSKESYLTELRDKIARVNAQIAAENTQYNDRKSALTKQRDDALADIDAENTNYDKWRNRMRGAVSVLLSELEELKTRETIRYEITVSHGRVLSPDVPNKIAFIDIGSRDRVTPGLKLMVAKRGDQGKFVYKALVEVKKVWMTYAEVSINQVLDDETPVIEGDLLVNPLFNTRRPVVVAIAGEERPLRLKPAWSLNEATRRIEEIGSVVAREPGLDVDFVIWTEGKKDVSGPQAQNAYPAFKTAILLEIPIAEASDIYRFLGD